MSWISILVALVLLAPAPGANAAADGKSHVGRRAEHSLGTDRFIAGSSVLVRQSVTGDLFAAGGELDVVATVNGDVVLAGGRVQLDATAGQDVYAAGGRVAVDGPIARNVRIAGGSVQIGPRAKVGGGATIAGGKIDVLGPIERYLQVAAGSVYIDAPVGGDVEVVGRYIELGPNARIAGNLRYAAEQAPVRHPEAQVLGNVRPIAFARGKDFRVPPWRGVARVVFWLWTAGLMLLAAVLVAAFPDAALRVARTARQRLGLSLLLGFAALVVIPSAAAVVAFTAVGMPLAVLAGLVYLGLLLVGYVTAGIALGDTVLSRWGAAHAQWTGRRAAAAAVAILVIGLLARVPVAGILVTLFALLIGMGAILLQFRRTVPAG